MEAPKALIRFYPNKDDRMTTTMSHGGVATLTEERRGRVHSWGADVGLGVLSHCPGDGCARDRGGAGVDSELSGRDNSRSNLAWLGIGHREMVRKVESIDDFTGLREFYDLPLKSYSSGMYARPAFGSAAAVELKILLSDKTPGVGDAEFGLKARACVSDRTNIAVIVSHDLSCLSGLWTQGLGMWKGRLVTGGPIHAVIDHYLSDVVATPAV
jgi:ABC-type polysaccharide/polyol phosphate transport system ATPase subunit